MGALISLVLKTEGFFFSTRLLQDKRAQSVLLFARLIKISIKFIHFLLFQTPFKIDTSTGDISLSKNLDYEKESMYNFSVLATDDGQPHRSA